MTIDIIPYERIGEFYLESSAIDLRNKNGGKFFTRVDKELHLINDYFMNSSIQVEYDKSGKAAFIGASKPAFPRYKGIDILNQTIKDIRKSLVQSENAVVINGSTILFPEIGLCFYGSSLEDGDCPEQVAVFRKGYFDSDLK